MRLEFHTFCFRLTLEIFRLGPEPVFRRYRVVPKDATVRRKLLRNVRRRLDD
jgi:hypothetical protein